MKVIKRKGFGSVVLGACSVKLIENKDKTYTIKCQQGTSSFSRSTPDASYALVIFDEMCEEAEKEHGPLTGPQQ